MTLSFKQARQQLFQLLPLILLFFLSLNGSSVINFNFFSINVHYILIYFWVLRQPKSLGYGFIFLSGIITDVVFGLPIGATPLALLVVAAVAAYVNVVTVRISLFNDWISFVPAILFANFIYFISLYFSNYTIDYFYLFKNSVSTFVF